MATEYKLSYTAKEIDEKLGMIGNTATGAVTSVNGKTGEVELTATDVGALSINGGKVNGMLSVDSEYGAVIVDEGQISLRTEDNDAVSVNIGMSITNDKPILHVYGNNDELVELTNIATPTTESSATNKAYVDETVVASRHTTDEMEHAVLGEELITVSGWNTDGWSGTTSDSTIEFTHASGNTNSLTYIMPESTAGKLYQISFNSSVPMTTDNLFVRVGNSTLFNLYGQADPISIGVRAPEDGNLEFIPSSDFTGTLSSFSVRQIVEGFDGSYSITDSDGDVAFSIRTTKTSDMDSQNGENNLFMGKDSGQWNTSGYCNVAVGSDVMKNNTSGFWNVGVGYRTLEGNTAGSRNIGIGYVALRKNEVGQRNIAIGTHALREHTDGDFNIAIGADSQLEGTTGEGNIGIGTGTLYKNSGGNYNIAIGHSALGGGETGTSRGDNNIAIGKYAMPAVTGSGNTVIGYQAGYDITNGNNNVVIGANSGRAGTQNVVLGGVCGQYLNQWSSGNILIGTSVGGSMSGGAYNILIGRNIPGESGSSYTYHLNIGNLLRGILVGGTDPHLEVNGGLQLSQIPTSDPAIAGRVWNDNGTLKVSAG